MKAVVRWLACAAFAVATSACGDADTNDNRGYTKAPLEHPTLLIESERPTAMAELRDPLVPVIREIPAPEPTDTAAAAPPADGGVAAQVELPEGVTQEMVAAGEQAYGGAGNCFACHGVAGAGTPLAPPLNDGSWLNIAGGYDEIVTTITEGVPQPAQFPAAMPPMGGAQLTETQVREIAAYVYSISR